MRQMLWAGVLLAGCTNYGRPVYQVEEEGMRPGDFAMVTLEVWGMTWNAWGQGTFESLSRLEGVREVNVNLAQSRAVVQLAKPVALKGELFKRKIDQVGFTLNRVVLETFGTIREKNGGHVFVVRETGQEIVVRLNPVAADAIAAKGDRIWIRGVLHGWKTQGGKAHMVLRNWGGVPQALIEKREAN